MKKYVVTLNGIIEADNPAEALQIFKESGDYGSVKCFEYNNDPRPWDQKPTCEDRVNVCVKP